MRRGAYVWSEAAAAEFEALGAVELSRPDWPPGSVIYRGADEPNLRVVDNLPSDDPEEFAILVVEEVP